MPWSDNSGGPWGGQGGGSNNGQGGGRGQGPWGGGGKRPPDIDDILRQGRERLKVIVGGGGGGRGRGGGSGGGGLGWKGWALGGVAAAAAWIASSIYIVNQGEQSVELLFGEYASTKGEGLHIAPWPIITYEKLPVVRENTIEIGYDTRGDRSHSGLMLTGDENIVDIDFQVVWNIKDLPNFLFNLAAPRETIQAVSESAMREVIGQSQLSPILNRDRGVVSDGVRDLVQQTMDSYDSGVNIVRINFDRADPPSEVIDAFRDVQAASQDRDTAEKQAEAYANRTLAEARGQAAELVQSAEAYRAGAVNAASGETSRFSQVLEEYRNAPEITRDRMYLETMEKVLGDVNIVLLDQQGEGGQGVLPYLPLNELTGRARQGGN